MHGSRVAVVLSLTLLAACGGGGGGEITPPITVPTIPTVTLNGSVQKGPFVSGSSISAFSVGSDGQIGERLVDATTNNNLGDFQIAVEQSQTIRIEAQGRFLNELNGLTSTSTLTLASMFNVGSATSQTANVNILTHLAAPRMQSLLSSGSSQQEAEAESRNDVLLALEPIVDPPQVNSLVGTSQYSSVQGDLGSAYMVTISALFIERAQQVSDRLGTDMYAELQVLLDSVSDDLKDGTIDFPGTIMAVRGAAYDIAPTVVTSSLVDLASIEGSNLFAGDINAFLDTDLDGSSNNIDTDDDNDGIEDTNDAYPQDWSCYLVADGDGTACSVDARIPSSYSADAIESDGQGNVFLLNAANNQLVRWSIDRKAYGFPLDLPIGATSLAYSPNHGRLYVGFSSGQVIAIETIGAHLQSDLASAGGPVRDLIAVGDHLLVVDTDDNWQTLDFSGAVADQRSLNFESQGYAWSDAEGRLYFLGRLSANDLEYVLIDPITGVFGSFQRTEYYGQFEMRAPMHVSDDGSTIANANADFFASGTVAWAGSLPGRFADMTWLADDTVATIKAETGGSTILQHYDDGNEVVETAEFPGDPLGVIEHGNRLMVISQESRPEFYYMTPGGDEDGDGVANPLDAFAADPAASADSDGDGHPDGWHSGMSESDSTTGLILDSYPNDSACFLPGHGDGTTCDIESRIPPYVPESIVVGADGVVYLLSVANRRIFRWDPANGHLNPVLLDDEDSPYLMRYSPDQDRIYVAYQSGRLSYFDLANPDVELYFASTPATAQGLQPAGDYLWVAGPGALSNQDSFTFDVDGNLASQFDTGSQYSTVSAWNDDLDRVYLLSESTSPSDFFYQEVDQTSGQLAYPVRSPDRSGNLKNAPLRISLDGSKALLGSGDIYNANLLTRIGSVSGGFTDTQWTDGGGIVVVRSTAGGTVIERRDQKGRMVEVVPVDDEPLALLRDGANFRLIFDDGRPTFFLYVPSDDSDGDGVANADDAFPLDVAASVDSDNDGFPDAWNNGMSEADSTTGLTLDAYPSDSACYVLQHGDGINCDIAATIPEYVPDSVVMDDAGVIYLFSANNRRVYRWDSVTEEYLNPIVIGSDNSLGVTTPLIMEYHAAQSRLYFGYDNGAVKYVDLADIAHEQLLSTTVYPVQALAAAGDNLLVFSPLRFFGAADVFDSNGTLLDSDPWTEYSHESVWDSSRNYLFHFDREVGPREVGFTYIDPISGEIGDSRDVSTNGGNTIAHPIRISADSSKLLLGSGDVFATDDLTWLGSMPGGFVDGLWNEWGGTVVLRDQNGETLVERRAADSRVIDTALFSGAPLAILPSGSGQIVVTDEGRPSFHFFTPSGDSDGDGVTTTNDAFPIDAAASVDTDGDGYPDVWNSGMSQADSTTGLELDAYPDDAECYLPGHGDGTTCDMTATMPDFVPELIEVDSSGMVYLFSPENQRVYRWDSVVGEYRSPLVIGNDDWLATETPRAMTYHPRHNRLYFGYGVTGGDITYIDLAGPSQEQWLSQIPSSVVYLSYAGNFLHVRSGQGFDYTFDANGARLAQTGQRYLSSTDFAWNDDLDRLFAIIGGDLRYRAINQTTGALSVDYVLSPNLHNWRNDYSVISPIRVAPDGSKVISGSGDIYNADTRTWQRSIPGGWVSSIPGGLVDVQWFGSDDTVSLYDNGPFSRVERRDSSGKVVEIVEFPRRDPLRLLPAGAGFVIVSDDGIPALEVYVPSNDTDADGISNQMDGFPNDAAAAQDSDADGYPDDWNAGMSQADSTSGLTLDAYPNDSACFILAQGDGTTCDIASTIPAYAPTSVEIDGAGVVYLFSSENRRIYRWDAVTQEHLNPLIVGPDVWVSDRSPNIMEYHSGQFRIYLGYQSGAITYIDLATTDVEQHFSALAWPVTGMADAGNFLLAQDRTGGLAHHILDSAGVHRHRTRQTWFSRTFEWDPVQSRVYLFRDWISTNDLHYEVIDQTTGVITENGETPYHDDYSIVPPLRVSDDGSRVLLGSGDIYNSNGLTWQFALPQPVLGAQWMGDGRLVTVRPDGTDTNLEILDGSYAVESSNVVPNAPISVLRFGDDVVIVTSGAKPEFDVVTP